MWTGTVLCIHSRRSLSSNLNIHNTIQSVPWGLRHLTVPLEGVDQLVHPDPQAKGKNRECLEDLTLQEHRENLDTKVSCENFDRANFLILTLYSL